MKIVELNDEAWTPAFTLNHAMEVVDNIEQLAITMKLKDGSLTTMTTHMPAEVMAILCKRLELRLEGAIIADHIESIEEEF